MTTPLTKGCFTFEEMSNGAYRVVYTSPITGKSFEREVNDLSVVDPVMNVDNPKIDLMGRLRRVVKGR